MKNLLFCLLLVGIITLSGCGDKLTSNETTWSCTDVTSYDHNRNNDMKCTSSHGNVKYTSYEGARVLESL